MAAREFHGIILNQWDSPLFIHKDDVDSGQWQDPWFPSKFPIYPGQELEWRSESDGILFGGIMTGTSGMACWSVKVLDPFDFDDHYEFVQVNWSVPYFQTDYPNITCAVFRNDPYETDVWAKHDSRAPILEIVPAIRSSDGRALESYAANDEDAREQAGEIVPYVLTIPVSWFITPLFGTITHPVVNFIVRRRFIAQSPLTTTATTNQTPQEAAMQEFRNRAEMAVQQNFVGAFPNFYTSTEGRNHLAGTVFIKATTAAWRDIPLSELGNVSLTDFEGRIRASNTWAEEHGFIGGFPTFYHADYGNGIVCGTVLIKKDGAEWRNIPLRELGNPAPDNFEAFFRAVQDYASRNDFVGGFPTFNFSEAVTDLHIRRQRMQEVFRGREYLPRRSEKWRAAQYYFEQSMGRLI